MRYQLAAICLQITSNCGRPCFVGNRDLRIQGGDGGQSVCVRVYANVGVCVYIYVLQNNCSILNQEKKYGRILVRDHIVVQMNHVVIQMNLVVQMIHIVVQMNHIVVQVNLGRTVSVCVCVYVCACKSMCVCVGERARERGSEPEFLKREKSAIAETWAASGVRIVSGCLCTCTCMCVYVCV